MTRKGKVSSADTVKNTARVVFSDFDEAVSSDIPVLKFRIAGQTEDTIQVLAAGDAVVCAFFGADLSDGVVLGKV